MVQAALSGFSSLVGGLSSQSSRPASEKPPIQSLLPYYSIAKDKKTARELKKIAEEERLYNLITQPEVLGLLMTFVGMVAAQHIPFSQNEAANEVLQGTATSAAVLIGLGHAGVGDLTTSILAGLAGITSMFGGITSGIPKVTAEIEKDWWKFLLPGGAAIAGGT